MIEVSITFRDGQEELAHVRIENMTTSPDGEYADYSIQFGVDTGSGWAVYQRAIHAFPRKQFNALALLRQALATLEEKELGLDGNPDDPSSRDHARSSRDLARRLRRALP